MYSAFPLHAAAAARPTIERMKRDRLESRVSFENPTSPLEFLRLVGPLAFFSRKNYE